MDCDPLLAPIINIFLHFLKFIRELKKSPSNVGMPHVLWELQGKRVPVYETKTEHGHDVQVFKGWEQTVPGTMTPLQFDQAMGDLVGYLQWMAEPAQNTRVRVGVWVLLFLCVMTLFAWRLNAAFWKDVK